MIDVPVVFIFFNKAESTKMVFEKIQKAQPRVLYLISDGPRLSKENEKNKVIELREWVEKRIDWNCSLNRVYSDENMGCKNRIISGLNHVFSKEKFAIILEDDCCPKDTFFKYCEKLLYEYIDNEEIMMISGNNQVPSDLFYIHDDYIFSKNVWIWGWATWARAWKLYDGEVSDWDKQKVRNILKKNLLTNYRIKQMEKAIASVHNHEIDTWDYQWNYCVLKYNGLTIIPRINLIDNLGFNTSDATHTTGDMPQYLKDIFFKNEDYNDEIRIVDKIERNQEFDKKYDDIIIKDYYRNKYSIKSMMLRIVRKIKKCFKNNHR